VRRRAHDLKALHALIAAVADPHAPSSTSASASASTTADGDRARRIKLAVFRTQTAERAHKGTARRVENDHAVIAVVDHVQVAAAAIRMTIATATVAVAAAMASATATVASAMTSAERARRGPVQQTGAAAKRARASVLPQQFDRERTATWSNASWVRGKEGREDERERERERESDRER
jgi:hypothetical protein